MIQPLQGTGNLYSDSHGRKFLRESAAETLPWFGDAKMRCHSTPQTK
jgi:hypothetical protein